VALLKAVIPPIATDIAVTWCVRPYVICHTRAPC